MPLERHWERQQTPVRARDRRLIGGLAAVLLTGVVVVLVASLGGTASQRGCVTVSFASTTGAARIHECGAAARRYCRAVGARHDTPAATGRAACRRSGIPVG